jgi:hypothetical protein
MCGHDCDAHEITTDALYGVCAVPGCDCAGWETRSNAGDCGAADALATALVSIISELRMGRSQFDGFESNEDIRNKQAGLLADGWAIQSERDAETGAYTVTLARGVASFTGEAESWIGGFEAAYGAYSAV